jgi:gamma-glutamylcyclotransferase (GGCT)/AIG2-like uncharacterized protein YtfP
MTEEKTITIDGKVYKESELPVSLKNIITVRAEILQSKVRHELELEKIDVLTNYYNNKIKEELLKLNGGSSKP